MDDVLEAARMCALAGLLVFPTSPVSKVFGTGSQNIATSDVTLVEAMRTLDPQCMFLVVTKPQYGLVALSITKSRDDQYLQADFGPLPPTLTTTRAGGGRVKWYAVPKDADVILETRLRGTRGFFRNATPLPGSVNPHSGERYIVEDGAFDLNRVAPLPERWLRELPKQGGITSTNAVTRAEYSPIRQSEWDW